MKALLCSLFIASAPVSFAQQPAATPEQRFYATLAAAGTGTNLGKTDTVGAPTGTDYGDTQPEGAVLVGLDLWKGNFENNLVIRGVCPIFQTATGRVRGPKRGNCDGSPTTTEAKPGFAVAGIEAKGGLRVDGLEIVFMRIHVSGIALDSSGSYKSEWVGGKGGGKPRRLVPNQKPIIGIFGGAGSELDRIGLLYYDRK